MRSLAGKSAAAAKETNDLIANSIQAVKNGEQITEQTAASLAAVGGDVSHILTLMDQVSSAYQEQAHKLSEIATGVDQISNVVQTNSATAEQSAAASQELSGQASTMRQQVLQFKLEGNPASGQADRPGASGDEMPGSSYGPSGDKY